MQNELSRGGHKTKCRITINYTTYTICDSVTCSRGILKSLVAFLEGGILSPPLESNFLIYASDVLI